MDVFLTLVEIHHLWHHASCV